MKISKNRIYLTALICGITLNTPAWAQGENPFKRSLQIAAEANEGGGMQGGGGDTATEGRIKSIRDNMLNDWILKGGSQGLKLPEGITHDDYLHGNAEKGVYGMLDILAPGAVVINAIRDNEQNMNDEEMNTYVDGYPKTCKGFISTRDHRPHIICSVERFWDMKPGWNDERLQTEQYRQIHHEYASLGRLEKNVGSDSDTFISDQIAKSLRYVTQLMLVVDPSELPGSAATGCYEKYTSPGFKAIADLKTKRKRTFTVIGRTVLIFGGAPLVAGLAGPTAAIAAPIGLATVALIHEGDNESWFRSKAISRMQQSIQAVKWATSDQTYYRSPKRVDKLIVAQANLLSEQAPETRAFAESIRGQSQREQRNLMKRWVQGNSENYLSAATELVRSAILKGLDSGELCEGQMRDIRGIEDYVQAALGH